MKNDLAKMLILGMLEIDDEPLNLILSEAIINEDNQEYITKPYKTNIITEKDLKESIRDLIGLKMIDLLSETGDKIDYSNLEEILDSNTEWVYWFRITESGKNFFDDNYTEFFSE